MNWFKTAQRYEDIVREDYEGGQEGDELYQFDQYLSIGQQDEREEPAYCWIFDGSRLDVAVGGTHGQNFPHLINWAKDRDNRYFRGWYDQDQDMLSVVAPRREGDLRQFDESVVPKRLYSLLAKKFGNTFDMKVF